MARATLTSPMAYSSSRTKYSVGGTSTMSRRHTPTNRFASTYSSSYGSSSNGTSSYAGAGSRPSVRSTGYGTSGSYNPSKYGSDKYSTSGSSGLSTIQKARDGLKPVARPRALPTGPGPIDIDGNRIDHKHAVASYKTSTYTRSHSLSRNAPLKADHTAYPHTRTYSPGMSSIGSNVDSPTPTGRLSRTKRTNSITDLSNHVDNISLSNTSFRNSKRFGSQADINHTSALSTPEKNYEKETITDEIYSTRTTPRGKASYGVTSNSYDHDGTDSGILPDIHGAGTSSLAKSNSQDRIKKIDDSPVSRRKNSYDSSRQNSNSSLNTSVSVWFYSKPSTIINIYRFNISLRCQIVPTMIDQHLTVKISEILLTSKTS